MSPGMVNRSLARVAGRVPGIRAIPLVGLLSAAEVAMLARDHYTRLNPAERARLRHLVKTGRGRTDRLTDRERGELEGLVTKLAPRELFGDAANRMSPVPLPRRLLYGRRDH